MGEEFEGWDVEYVAVRQDEFTTFSYGTCDIGWFDDHGCAPPLQIRVYRGQGSDEGLALRALEALRSVNSVPPVVDVDDPIPAAPRTVLAASDPCSA